MADVCFLETEVAIFQLWIDYVDEIWFVDRFWPAEGSDLKKYETGSSI